MADPATHESDFHGLTWVQEGIWDVEPRWTIEPNEEAIRETVQSSLNLPASPNNTINFLAQGAFNKVYVVAHADKEVIARVTLPADPIWKTLSEVATLRWVRENTSLPVPDVLAYQADRSSAIGFEWIAMTKIPGRSLRELWRDVSLSAKEEIVRQLAVFCAETFRAQLRGIGNLYLLDDTKEASPSKAFSPKTGPIPDGFVQSSGSFRVGRIVSPEFIWENRIHAEVSRGPFVSSKDWLLARLELVEIECRRGLSRLQRKNSSAPGHEKGGGPQSESGKDSEGQGEEETTTEDREADKENDNTDRQKDNDEDDEGDDDLEDLTNTMSIISRLRPHLDDFIPAPTIEPEPSMILHDDLSRSNTMVDHNGTLTGVIDWECVSAVPLWAACQMPSFLAGKPRDDKPDEAIYQHDEDGNVTELFWEHLDEYELTRLRSVFLGEIGRLQPGWVEVFESSQRQRDFDLAVSCCNDEFMIRRILNWLDDVERGVDGYEGLEERIDNASL